jgi:hypothetical protein
MLMKKITTLLIILIVIILATLYIGKDSPQDISTTETSNTETTATPVSNDLEWDIQGSISDVTDGVVRNINTEGLAKGTAQASFSEKTKKYNLLVTIENLPDPDGDDFYEGWVVRRGENFSVISTGSVEKVNDVYTNNYEAELDLLDHDFYVLTLEPNDGDPAPADHIAEGVMQ